MQPVFFAKGIERAEVNEISHDDKVFFRIAMKAGSDLGYLMFPDFKAAESYLLQLGYSKTI